MSNTKHDTNLGTNYGTNSPTNLPRCAALLSAALLALGASQARAQPFDISVRASSPSGTWNDGEIDAKPGDTVCIWVKPQPQLPFCPTNPTIFRVASMTFQIEITGMLAGDSIVPFDGINGVNVGSGLGGRINPFALPDHGIASIPGPIIVHPGIVQRIAGTNATTPESGDQLGINIGSPIPVTPPILEECTFIYYKVVGPPDGRIMTVDVRADQILNNTITWWDGPTGATCVRTISQSNIQSLTINVISPCDSIDFNNDGLFPDTLDIDDFLAVFSGLPCSNDPNCNDIDFNNDGLFPDTLDIDSLLSVFAGGSCLT